MTTKSDGGSSSYYELALPKPVIDSIKKQLADGVENPIIETGDVIKMLVNNDFDAANVIKALRRIFMSIEGKGKEGTDIAYDLNKCDYFINEIRKYHG